MRGQWKEIRSEFFFFLGVNLIEGFHLKPGLGFGRVFCKYLKHVFLYYFLSPSSPPSIVR